MRSAYSLVKSRQRRNQAVGSNNAEESAKKKQQLQGPSNPRKQKHISPDPEPKMSGEDAMNSAEAPIFVEEPAPFIPQTRNFLPIAMPRPDPPEDGAEHIDAEYEYRSVFEPPDDIEVLSRSNAEAENHDDAATVASGMSALSGLTGLNTLGTFTQHRIDTLSKVNQDSNQSGKASRDNQFRGEQSRSRQVHRELSKKLQIQRRNAQKLFGPQNRIADPRNKPASQKRQKQNQLARGAQIRPSGLFDEVQEIAENSQDCFAGELRKLPSIEEVLDDVEKKVFNAVPRSAPEPKQRRGLPYEPTDYNADEEESVTDPWDSVITPTSEKKAQERSFKRDPEECDDQDDQIQGPPTPRKRLSESMFDRVRETLSSEGAVVIDITDIEDEDIEHISKSGSNPNDNQTETAAHSISTKKQANNGMRENSGSARNYVNLRQGAQGTRPVKKSGSSEGRKKVDVHRHARGREAQPQREHDDHDKPQREHDDHVDNKPQREHDDHVDNKPQREHDDHVDNKPQREHDHVDDKSSRTFLSLRQEAESDDEPLVGESFADIDDDNDDDDDDDEYTPNMAPDMGSNIESRDAEPERTQEEDSIFSSSFAYFKSVATDLGSQLQSIDLSSKLESIQKITSISDNEMDKMLGVLGKGLKETSDKTPEKSSDIVFFLGEELEKTACGIDRTTQGENDYVLSEKEVESATRTFQCGLHKPTPYQGGLHKPMPYQGEPAGLLQKRMESNGQKSGSLQTYSVSVNDEAEQLQAAVSKE
jgi:hypothetical protein